MKRTLAGLEVASRDKTVEYYDASAREYSATTRDLDMSPAYSHFLPLLPSGGHILDAGCGAGRDTRAFLDRGFQVTATDASRALAQEASLFTGLPVRVARHEMLSDVALYDGIWACATLLHVPRSALPDVMSRLARALKPGGVLYATFKMGDTERTDSLSRRFTDMTPGSLTALIAQTGAFELMELFTEPDAQGRQDTTWVVLVARRI
jgi:SAM-dependent methyltransferase